MLVYAGLLFAVIAWGGSFVAARAILAGDGATLSPIILAALRFTLASALLLPLAASRMRREAPLRSGDLLLLFLLGQLGISVYFWLQYTGVQLTNAGISAILVVGLIPAATAVVARLALREGFTRAKVLGLALGAAGVIAVALQRDMRVSLESGFLFGTLCLVANAFCFAFYSTAVRRLRARYSSLTLTGLTTASGTAGLLLLGAMDGGWARVGELSAGQWWALAFLVVACSVVAYLAYNYSLARLEASVAVTWVYLEPVVAVVFGAALLAEQVTGPTIVGGLLIAGSVFLVQRA
ncbi:MAG: DMT family transporter [Bacteroidetes bacterium]|nr:DMT family transporter [Bacteroidota bacterium]MCL5025452.1 DMT family transporter [Chloroflexota bacterium]